MDWLSLTCYGDFDEAVWDELRLALETAKKKGQDGDESGQYVKLPGGQVALVEAFGRGNGGGYRPWVVKWSGIEVSIVDLRESPVEGGGLSFNAIVEIPGTVFLRVGLPRALALMTEFLRGLGYRCRRSVPSRVDVCCDLADVDVSEFVDAFVAGRRVTRAKKSDVFFRGLKTTGFRIGSGVGIRCYDKLEECKRDPEKLELMRRHRWGYIPKQAVRVEGQLRRDKIRELHAIDSLDDLLLKLRSLCDWLVTEWFRLVDVVPDRRNTQRFKPSALWARVVKAFEDWAGDVLKERESRGAVKADSGAAMKQAFGCLAAAMACEGQVPSSFEEVQDFFDFWLERFGDAIFSKVRLKRMRLEALRPAVRTVPAGGT